ncbi:MAG: VWA domain-containing protein [Acidobacteriota bacterium]|nr:VWA domain-containing protein [Acidobacteriota bacterium]
MTPILLATALVAAPIVAQEPIAGTLSEAIDVTVVNVEVFARDRARRPAADLLPKDFRLFDNDKSAEITAFSRLDDGSAERPFGSVAVFIDERHISAHERQRALAWLGPLVLRLMEEQRLRAMVVGFGEQLNLYQTRTRSRNRVARGFEAAAAAELVPIPIDQLEAAAAEAYKRLKEQLGDIRQVARGSGQLHGIGAELSNIGAQMRRDTVFVGGGLQRMLDALALSKERTALVVVSSGFALQPLDLLLRDLQQKSAGAKGGDDDLTRSITSDEARGLDALATADQFAPVAAGRVRSRTQGLSASLNELSTVDLMDQLMASANSSRVTFLPLRLGRDGGGVANTREVTDNNAALEMLSNGTGGHMVADSAELEEILLHDHQGAATYLLGYAVPGLEDASVHRVRVKARRKGVRLEYRRSYIARSLPERLASKTAAALFLGAEANEHQVKIDAVKAKKLEVEGRSDLEITVSLPLSELEFVADGRQHSSRVRLVAWMHTADDRLMGPHEVIAPIDIPAADFESARDQSFGITFGFNVPLGKHRIAIGVWDETAGEGSFIRNSLRVR